MNITKHYTWAQFLDWVDWSDESIMPTAKRSSQKIGDVGFSGVPNFESAMKLARYGWADGVKEFRAIPMPAKIPAFKELYQIESVYNIAGGAVDIGRFLTGDPECMRNQVIINGFNIPAGFAKCVVMCSYSGGTSRADVMQYGFQVCNIVVSLERANIRTEIILLEQVTVGGNRRSVFITLKKAEESFYIEKILFPIANPAFQRRLVFSENERNPEDIQRTFGFGGNGGYGGPCNIYEGADAPDTLYFNGPNFSRDKINAKLATIFARHEKAVIR